MIAVVYWCWNGLREWTFIRVLEYFSFRFMKTSFNLEHVQTVISLIINGLSPA